MAQVPRAIKLAAIDQVSAARAAGLSPTRLVEDLARQHGVTVRRVWAWCAGEGLGGHRTVGLTTDELIEIASFQGNARKAYERLRSLGKCDLSYSQFMRRLAATDAHLRVGVTEGMAAVHQVGLYNVQKGSYARGDVLGFDHTEIPVFIAHGARKPFKVWISVCMDWGTGFIFAPVFTMGEGVRGDPNTASIVSLLASVFIGQPFDGELVGGLPTVVIFDNARQHLAEECANGYASLGVRIHAISPGSPWENGPTENAVGVLEQEIWRGLPGYSHHLPTRYGRFPWAPEDLLSFRSLVAHTLAGIDRINRNVATKAGAGEGSRLKQWRSAEGVVEFADPAVVRHAFTRSPRRSYIVGKQGVHFQNVLYSHSRLKGMKGREVEVRHLQTDPSFIDVYVNGEVVCTATPADSLSQKMRSEVTRARRADEREVMSIHKRAAALAVKRAKELDVDAVFADDDSDAPPSAPDVTAEDRDEAATRRFLRLIEGGKSGST